MGGFNRTPRLQVLRHLQLLSWCLLLVLGHSCPNSDTDPQSTDIPSNRAEFPARHTLAMLNGV